MLETSTHFETDNFESPCPRLCVTLAKILELGAFANYARQRRKRSEIVEMTKANIQRQSPYSHALSGLVTFALVQSRLDNPNRYIGIESDG